jgi:4-hydroxy-3-methylbut-2-en-1-yl diphosphate reductase
MEVILAEPRGFCAGVKRAISIVELALKKFGSPIYVKHEIVHNKIVIESLKSQGVIFTDDLSVIPNGSILIYSAHGVSNQVELDAKNLNLISIDATCPLVKKVHRSVINYEEEGYTIILIGHKNHPEIEGTAGKLKNNNAIIIEAEEDVKNLELPKDAKLAISTQTTLSIDDTKNIILALQNKFPQLKDDIKNDICYATQNRQNAVNYLINNEGIDCLIVIGSQNSSNSSRLKDIGIKNNIKSFLINFPNEINFEEIKNSKKIGITAGASAPESLIEKLLEFLKQNNQNIKITLMDGIKEDTIFHIPKQLR